MSKPIWDDAPEWATALAMDECGEWYWYERVPNQSSRTWTNGGRIACAEPVEIEWEDSLEFRPDP